MVLGVIITVIAVPLLIFSLFLASLIPYAAGGAGGIALIALFLVALGIGLMHDSTYKQKETSLQSVPQPIRACIKCGRLLYAPVPAYCPDCGTPIARP